MRSATRHFTALDGWRGICACLVAVFHLQAFSHLMDVGVVRHAFFYVDFFFVLSGFVIAANYADALGNSFGIARFMLLRFGRLYPLHIATLAVFVALECAGALVPALEPAGKLPFTGEGRTLGSLVANLFLVQGLGTERSLSWNYPSWSISVEFATYFLFALAAAALPRRVLRVALLSAAVAAPIAISFLSPHDPNVTYDYGVLRSVSGFAAGALMFDRFVWLTERKAGLRSSTMVMSVAEFAAVGLGVTFISLAATNVAGFAAPLVFAAIVLVFAFEGGVVSRLLKTRPLVAIGALSYSIYMVHAPLEHCVLIVARAAERLAKASLFSTTIVDGESTRMVGTTLWWGDTATIAVLAATIVVSWLTYRGIEMPARQFTRRLAKRWFPDERVATPAPVSLPYPSSRSA